MSDDVSSKMDPPFINGGAILVLNRGKELRSAYKYFFVIFPKKFNRNWKTQTLLYLLKVVLVTLWKYSESLFSSTVQMRSKFRINNDIPSH